MSPPNSENSIPHDDPAQRPVGASNPLPNVLSRWQLTAALVSITLLPFLLVVVLYSTLPTGADPTLRAQVAVEPRAWPSDRDPAARLVPCVVLSNPTGDEWNNVNMSINKQFHFYHPDPMRPGENLSVPLKFFHTKGNQYFPPESQQLKQLTVFAQIPSGRRAILEIPAEQLPYSPEAESTTGLPEESSGIASESQ